MPKFAISDRLYVPGLRNTQGVVTKFSEEVTGFPVYYLVWFDDKAQVCGGSVGEGDLIDAQPETILLCANIPALKVMIERAPAPKDRIFKSKPKPKRKR
jgi:hypothetical protein